MNFSEIETTYRKVFDWRVMIFTDGFGMKYTLKYCRLATIKTSCSLLIVDDDQSLFEILEEFTCSTGKEL